MDTQTYLLPVLSVVGVSLISLIGIFGLTLKKGFLERITLFLVSLAAGTMVGDVFIHIIPEIFEESLEPEKVSIYIIVGIIIFFILEKFLHWTHCHHPITKKHAHPLAVNNLLADGVHNFIDGIIIGAGYLISVEVGIATTIAVVLHEIPQEIGDFGVLIHSGMRKRTALIFNFLSALLSVIGVVVALTLGEASENITHILLAFAAGGFIYIAIADLLPEIKHEDNLKKSILQLVFFIIGILVMFGLTLVE